MAIPTDMSGADQTQPLHVLMVHSFGTNAPPFTVLSTAFESTIKHELGEGVDIDQVSLAMTHYAQPDLEDAFAEFLSKRMSVWQPNLVVPVGAPAGQFVAKYRDRLFPQTPVLYAGMDKRVIAPDALAANATFVGYSVDFKLLAENILQVAPETNHVVVIVGATSLERYWTPAYQDAFRHFAGRVKVTFVNDLSFQQMLELVSKLPPHSFVLLTLLLRDASGVSYNQDEALARLHAVSRAPINGLFDHQVGLGIVGGRLLPIESTGVEAARTAARILRGEPASSITPRIMEISPPTYDWRELRRWGISENRLPPGSTVLFRQPTTWELYRWHVAGALVITAIQTALISALLIQRRRRTLAEQASRKALVQLRQKQDQLGLAAEAANAAMWVWDIEADELWITEHGRSMFGFKPDVRLNFKATQDLVHPDDRARRESAIRSALELRGGYEIEYRTLEPDGTLRWIHGRARCAEPMDGTGLKLYGISLDVTDRKLAETAAAREREELQEKRTQLEHVARVATIGELTSTLTHELKQPLTAILANSLAGARLIKAAEPDLAEISDTFADISEVTRRADEMIDGLRNVLKRDTGGFSHVDLNLLIRTVERIVQGDARRHRVTVDLELSPDVMPIQGDSVQLQQVILNLMLNGFNAMREAEPDSRRMVVRTKTFEQTKVLVEVQDSGTGIAAEKLQSIFEPFTTGKSDGLGLGLSICSSIITRHGGKMWATNNRERGATFSILFNE